MYVYWCMLAGAWCIFKFVLRLPLCFIWLTYSIWASIMYYVWCILYAAPCFMRLLSCILFDVSLLLSNVCYLMYALWCIIVSWLRKIDHLWGRLCSMRDACCLLYSVWCMLHDVWCVWAILNVLRRFRLYSWCMLNDVCCMMYLLSSWQFSVFRI